MRAWMIEIERLMTISLSHSLHLVVTMQEQLFSSICNSKVPFPSYLPYSTTSYLTRVSQTTKCTLHCIPTTSGHKSPKMNSVYLSSRHFIAQHTKWPPVHRKWIALTFYNLQTNNEINTRLCHDRNWPQVKCSLEYHKMSRSHFQAKFLLCTCRNLLA